MAEITLESLAARLAVVEKQLAEQQAAVPSRTKDWRRTVGMFAENDFIKELDAECTAIREAERAAAKNGAAE